MSQTRGNSRAPVRNPVPLGNAWFVSDFELAANADEKIAAIKGFNSSKTAIIDQRFAGQVEGKTFTKDTAGYIRLIEYQPDYLKYEMKAEMEQLVVFSDVYYEDEWNASTEGQAVPHFRVNYILRAMVVPPGEHTIEFTFHPKSLYLGNKVSYTSSILLILAIVGYFISETRKRKRITGDIKNI